MRLIAVSPMRLFVAPPPDSWILAPGSSLSLRPSRPCCELFCLPFSADVMCFAARAPRRITRKASCGTATSTVTVTCTLGDSAG
jgi:hypothetical protein